METMKIDDFSRYTFLSGLKHSPDGKHACFVAHQINMETNCYRSNLWLLEIATERYFQLTAFDSEKSFIWLDNENILFPDIRDSQDQKAKDAGESFTQYYKINIHGGEAAKVLRIPRQVNSLKVLNENTYLFVSDYDAKQRDLAALTDEEKSEELNTRKEEQDYEVIEEIPFWANGDGFTSRKRQRLYLYHVQSGKVEPVTDEHTAVEAFNLNQTKTKAVIVANRFTDKMSLANDILIYDVTTNEINQLCEPARIRHDSAHFLADDVIIYTGSNMKSYGINENALFFIRNLASPASHCITPTLDTSVTNSVGSDCRYGSSDIEQVDQDYLYFVSTEGDSSFINRISRSGKIEKLTTGNGSVDAISISSGNILYVGMKVNKLQELFKHESSVEQQATNMNEWIQTERQVAIPEQISVETEVGVSIDGWVIKPIDFDAAKKYPAILAIHGGPKTVYGAAFFHDMQYWASEGYAIFFCNPRGSDGKGNAFADIRGKYGTIDYDDIMKFTDAVMKKYSFIDPKRVGVTGGSYGGYMTNWIIGHTDRFKAAVSERSISNWISKFCTTDIGYYFVEDQITATPWNDQEKLWQHSPLNYADQVKTPTLFLHSEEDYRCWLAEGLQMFTALKFHGAESRLCLFRGENHDLSRSGKPKHRLRRLKEITEWFNKYLK
jgi:dipeptidyl aminopeptidase/acylaminoacyl peptidase